MAAVIIVPDIMSVASTSQLSLSWAFWIQFFLIYYHAPPPVEVIIMTTTIIIAATLFMTLFIIFLNMRMYVL